MELSDLTIFCCVAEHEGITAAARFLNRVPSNVTTRIQNLEKDLGVNLFIRERNRLHLSPAGQEFLTHAQDLLKRSEIARSCVSDNTPRGRLDIGSIEIIAASRLSRPLAAFHRDHPQVDLRVSTGNSAALLRKLQCGELDVAFVSGNPQGNDLVHHQVYSDELVLLSDGLHKPIGSPDDLAANTTLIAFSHGCAYRRQLIEWSEASHAHLQVIEIHSFQMLLNCISAGMGVGLVPAKLLPVDLLAEGLQTHALPISLSRSESYLAYRKDSFRPSVKAFLNLVQQGEIDT
ncbi:MAG: DNA-binding transcriptional LysR family regulator [Flavobacteriales bacterium]|jgi:DNA-binding transcriptional LysR family regulator